jgi:2-polyprenyl-6-methoxyphenol hydroxylase-like FAD-dependent oxidoreductase
MSPTMEKTSVIIIGAGPAGLALALSLAKYEVHVRRFLLEYIHV